MNFPKKDKEYMQQVFALASKGLGCVSPNPLVGAIIVKNDKIVGTGYHRGFKMPHAEAEAIKMAGDKARGATIYVNLEPCCHKGNNPPCTDLIKEAGIKKVIFSGESGMETTNFR